MIVRFSRSARAAIREKREWWSVNRDRAPGLFAAELAAVVAKLRAGADEERRRHGSSRGAPIWSLAMRKVREHVYYRYDENGDIEVVAIWNATAGAPPPL